ncbi:hypothetical protein GCWU000341_00213 [Oribacterium sp. oral taxon 078 str. F0262]|nr:hypothetical protein GCWU000341_00213 [Oribacterium sp. oral taxon 078 str. F0262]
MRKWISCKEFQSTLPSRGATYTALEWDPNNLNFNPRSPRGERRYSSW